MKRTLDIVLIILLTIGFLGCKQHKSIDNYQPQIEVEFDEGNVIPLSKICSKVEYVILEQHETSLIGIVDKIVQYDNSFFMLDTRKNTLHRFSLEGEYMAHYKDYGKGPGEFLEISSFSIDTTSNHIYAVDIVQNKVLKTDLNFNFVSEIKKPGYFDALEVFNDTSHIYFSHNYFNPDIFDDNDSHNIIITDSEGNIQRAFLPIPPEILNAHATYTNLIVKYGDGVNVSPPFTNSIYFVTPDTCVLKYHLDFKKNNIPSSFFYQMASTPVNDYRSWSDAFIGFLKKLNGGNYASPYNIFENKSFFLFSLFIRQITDEYIVIHNKKTGETITGLLDNDIDHGAIGTPLGIYGNRLLTIINPHDLKDKIKKLTNQKSNDVTEKRLKAMERMLNQSRGTNPILVIYTLKN